MLSHFASAVPAGGDSWSYYWNLWWIKRALLDEHTNPFFSPLLYYPSGASLYFHTLNFLPGVVVAPITKTFGPAPAFNVLVFGSFIATGYGMYRLALYVLRSHHDVEIAADADERNRVAAWLAGVIFAFSSYRYVHLLGHLDLLQTQFVPLYFLALLKANDTKRLTYVFLAGGIFAATLLTAAYYMVFLLLATLLFGVAALRGSRDDNTAALVRLGAVLMVGTVLAAPVLVPMLVKGMTAGRTSNPFYDAERFSTDVVAFAIPSPIPRLWSAVTAPIYRHIMRPNSNSEIIGFLGFVPLFLALCALGSRNRDIVRRWGVFALAFAVLALGPVIHVWGAAVLPALRPVMPYSLISRLPYGNIPRVPGRFVVLTMAAIAVIAAIGARLLLAKTRRFHLIACAGLTAAAVCENAVVPLPLLFPRVPNYFTTLRDARVEGGLLEVPIPDDPGVFPVRMLFQTLHGKPIFGGALARGLPPLAFDAVPGFAQLKHLSSTVDDIVSYSGSSLVDISRIALRSYGAHRVVIEKQLMPPPQVEAARRVADELFGSAAVLYEDDDTVVYDVTVPQGRPAIAVWLDTGWSYLERSPDTSLRWHWMGERATLGVFAPEATVADVTFTAQSFGRPRRLRFGVPHQDPAATFNVGIDRAKYELRSLSIPAGMSFIEIDSLDGAGSPPADPRSLSAAMFSLQIVRR